MHIGITEISTNVAIQKTKRNRWKIALNGILGGIYIGIGAMFSINSIAGLEHLPYGIIKLVSGLAFSIGLILVMVAGAEIFTGDALMITAVFDRKIKIRNRIKNLSLIRITNFIGAIILIVLLYIAGRDQFGGGVIGETLLSIGEKKIHYGRRQALSLGMLCNILVCLGVRLARSGKSLTDKILGIIFPVTAFVACGFEHCVANMFYLPYAWVLGLETTISQMLLINFLPVTIGNLLGGAIFVGMFYRWLKE